MSDTGAANQLGTSETSVGVSAAVLAQLRRNGIFLADHERPRRLGFLFPGHGSQYLDMLAGLIDVHPGVRETLAELDVVYSELTGGPLTSRFLSARGASAEQLADPEVMQPAIFAASMSLFRAVTDAGVRPELLIGHSLGEFAALTAAGVLDLASGLRAVHARAVAVKSLPPQSWGAMLAVTVSGTEQRHTLVAAMLRAQHGCAGVVVTAIENAPDVQVIAGPQQAIEQLRVILTDEVGMSTTLLPVTHAFHSPTLHASVAPLYEALRQLHWNSPKIPVLSTVVGRLWTAADVDHLPTYLAAQLVTPFSFVNVVRDAVATGIDAFVEVGPKPVLSALVERIDPAVVAVPTNVPSVGDVASLERALAFTCAEGFSTVSAPTNILDALVTCAARLSAYPRSLIDVDAALHTELALPRSVVNSVIQEAVRLGAPVCELSDPSLRVLAGSTSSAAQTSVETAPSVQTVDVAFSQENSASSHGVVTDAIASEAPAAPLAPDTSATEDPGLDPAVVQSVVVDALVAKTGYPAELIEPGLDLEADLGIDSVKRAEVLGEVAAQYRITTDSADLGSLATVTAIVDFVTRAGSNPESAEKVSGSRDPFDAPASQLPIEQPCEQLVAGSAGEADPGLDPAVVQSVVVDALVAKTGYPAELIEPGLDLEADLGIDSVKRAEVLGEVAAQYRITTDSADLGSLATVTAIVDFVTRAGSAPTALPPAQSQSQPHVIDLTLPADAVATRYVAVSVPRPLTSADAGTGLQLGFGTVLVLPDRSRAVADALAAVLAPARVVILDSLDYSDLDTVATELARRHAELGIIAAVIDLSALGQADFDADTETWARGVDDTFAAAFMTAREVYADLKDGRQAAAWLAATEIGGVFATALPEAGAGNPLGGITSGFVKSLSRELPELRAKIVDVTPGTPADTIASLIATELAVERRSDDLEIGYLGDERHIVKMLPSPLPDDRPVWRPEPGTVAVVSGGSRGITLECVEAMAAWSEVTVVVLGRTVVPDDSAPGIALSDAEWEAARPQILREQRELHPDWAPVRLAREYDRLGNARELRRTLDRLAAMPGTVVYRSCDIADAAAVRAVVADAVAAYGPISTVVHAAGLESLGAVPKKPVPHSVDVVRVKGRGLHNLWHAVAGQPVQAFVSFGSVSGRCGMDGQVDYTAGSALLSVVSAHLARRNPGVAVTTIDWTAWAGTGMADYPTVRQVQEEQRGLRYIGIAEGVRHFERELALGSDTPEVLYFGELGSNEPRGQLSALDTSRRKVVTAVASDGAVLDRLAHPMLHTAQISGDRVRAQRMVSRVGDLYLDDHLVQGRATFPGVLHIETQAETASLLAPGQQLIETRDVSFDQFLRCRDGDAVDSWVTAQLSPDGSISAALHSAFTAPNGTVLDADRLHSSGSYRFGMRARPHNSGRGVPHAMEGAKKLDLQRYYDAAEEIITFGPTFRYLTRAGFHTANEVVCELVVPKRPGLLAGVSAPQFLTAPLVIDNVGRAALMWGLHTLGAFFVPRRMSSAMVLRDVRAGETLYGLVRIIGATNETMHCDITVTDAADLVVCEITNIELAAIAARQDGPYDLTS